MERVSVAVHGGEAQWSAMMPWRILSIDDDPEVHRTYQAILDDRLEQRFGDLLRPLYSVESDWPNASLSASPDCFTLEHAMGGEEGYLQVVQAQQQGTPYAVILLDMRMPGGWDGMKTAEQIRAVDPAVRIVLVTAFIDYELQEVRQRIGLNFEFLKKPVDPNELIQLVLSLSHGWSEQRELVATREALEQARAELESTVEQRTRELSSSREESEQILEAMNEGVVVVDRHGVIERSNPRLQQLCGKSAEQLRGSSVHALFTDSAMPLLHGQRFLRAREGKVVPVDVRGALLWQSGVDAVDQGAVLVVHDLSERLHAEEADRTRQQKERFFASVSHELRTPLTAIIGYSELLSEMADSSFTAEQGRMLRAIEISGRTQLALVNDILDQSKIEAGKFEIDDGVFDLRTVLDEIHHIFELKAQDAGLQLSIVQPELSHQLCGDGRRIAQILINLLSNAIKFTGEGGVTLEVSIDPAEAQLGFLVEDSGIGMAESDLQRLFQPFEQADRSTSSRYGGTGLGLHISRRLARLMGGEISVESRLGEGSRFRLTLPYRPSDQPALAGVACSVRQELRYFRGRVLIAEDTPELQLLESRLLRVAGVEVTVVNNGSEAVSVALAQPFDLILMDMEMPEMDGIEATQTLRRLGVETPIVALTANVMQHHRDQFQQAGCDAFLSKPIERAALGSVLLDYLQEREAGGEALRPLEEAPLLDEKLMALFVERTGILLQQLREALSGGHWEGVRSVAHTVKGAGSTFGHPELTRVGQEVLQLIDQQLIERLPPRVERLIGLMEAAASASPVE